MRHVAKTLQTLFLILTIGTFISCGEPAESTETDADEILNEEEEDELVAGASRQDYVLSELCCGDSVVNPFDSMELQVWLKDYDDNPVSYEGVFFEIVDLEPFEAEQEIYAAPYLPSRRVNSNSQGVAKGRIFVGDFAGKIKIRARNARANDLMLTVYTAAAPALPLISNVQGQETSDDSSCAYPKSIDKAQNHINDEIFINLADINPTKGISISSMIENQLPNLDDGEDQLTIQKMVVLFPPELNHFILSTGGAIPFIDDSGEMVSLTSTLQPPLKLKRGRARVIQSPLISSHDEANLFKSFLREEFDGESITFMAMVYVEAITSWGTRLTSNAAPLLIGMCLDCDEPSTAECK